MITTTTMIMTIPMTMVLTLIKPIFPTVDPPQRRGLAVGVEGIE
jgi:hypothetical protein